MKTPSSKTFWAVINAAWILAGTTSAATRLEIQMVPMLKLTGEVGSTNRIQYVTDLSQTNNWLTLTNIVLSTSPSYFVDTSSAGTVTRYFRAVQLTSSLDTNTPANPNQQSLVWINPGTFLMGSPSSEVDRESDEGPQTVVTLTRGYWMGKYEVTQAEYQSVVGSNPSYFTGNLNRPVEQVSWNDAISYCTKLTERERVAGRLPAGYVYRLPTEAEWEYAARAGTTTRLSYGDDPGYTKLGDYAWYSANTANTTHPVGQKLANAWGLYDMAGNVWEWCLDWTGTYPGGSVTDPRGPASGSGRVVRGGGWWILGAWDCRSARRGNDFPDDRINSVLGFRVVLAPGQP